MKEHITDITQTLSQIIKKYPNMPLLRENNQSHRLNWYEKIPRSKSVKNIFDDIYLITIFLSFLLCVLIPMFCSVLIISLITIYINEKIFDKTIE